MLCKGASDAHSLGLWRATIRPARMAGTTGAGSGARRAPAAAELAEGMLAAFGCTQDAGGVVGGARSGEGLTSVASQHSARPWGDAPVPTRSSACRRRVCQEPGARIARNMRLADMDLPVPAADARRIEIVCPWFVILVWGPACCRYHLHQPHHSLRRAAARL